jgi:hypothetical protein
VSSGHLCRGRVEVDSKRGRVEKRKSRGRIEVEVEVESRRGE